MSTEPKAWWDEPTQRGFPPLWCVDDAWHFFLQDDYQVLNDAMYLQLPSGAYNW